MGFYLEQYMHTIEPYDNWLHIYNPVEDELSPFYGVEHSEFEYSQTVYNYYIHPLWNDFGSKTLYMKVLFVDYDLSFAIIEFIGEWNDAIENDIMQLKREIVDVMLQEGIYKFLLITENVMNYHSDEPDYYEEWHEDLAEHGGWVVLLNTPEHLRAEMQQSKIDHYAFFMDYEKWRTHQPKHLYDLIDNQVIKLLD